MYTVSLLSRTWRSVIVILRGLALFMTVDITLWKMPLLYVSNFLFISHNALHGEKKIGLIECWFARKFGLLEPYILECEVKWDLESITTNKASGGDGISVELFQILKDDAVKVLHQYDSKFGKLSSGHRTGKAQFSFQSQRKAMPKMLKLSHNCTHLTC